MRLYGRTETYPVFSYILFSGNRIKYYGSEYSKSGVLPYTCSMVGGTGIFVDNSSALYDDDDPMFHSQILVRATGLTISNNRSSITNTLITGAIAT